MRSRPVALAAAATLVLGPVSACGTEPTPSASGRGIQIPSSVATPAATATPGPPAVSGSPTPRQTAFFGKPRSVAMSNGVPARVACEVAPGRTLRLTRLDGDIAYGYESEVALYSKRDDDRGTPPDVALYLSACDLTTGVVTRLPEPAGYPAVEEEGRILSALLVADIDHGRLLLFGDHYAGGGPGSYLLDQASGSIEPIDEFMDRGVQPVALEGDDLLGTQTLETGDRQTVAALFRRGTEDFRLLTPNDVRLSATWLRPVEIRSRVVVGDTQNSNTSTPAAVWAYRLDTAESIKGPPALQGLAPTVTAFDGGTMVGYVSGSNGVPQPFAWNIRDLDATWLPLPRGRTGGVAWDVGEGLVIGNTDGRDSGDGEPSWHKEKRGIVWDLRTGKFLDLGAGPASLSGTLVADTGLPPESVVAGVQGHHVLGFLGDTLEDYSGFYFPESIYNFGGTPVVWDISDWLASIR